MLSDGAGGVGSNPPACSGTDLDHRPAFARLLRRIPRRAKATRRRRSRSTAAAMRQSDCSRPSSTTASMRRLPTCARRGRDCFSAPRSRSFMLSAFCATSTSIAISRRLMATNSAGAFRTRRIWSPIFSRPRDLRPRIAACGAIAGMTSLPRAGTRFRPSARFGATAARTSFARRARRSCAPRRPRFPRPSGRFRARGRRGGRWRHDRRRIPAGRRTEARASVPAPPARRGRGRRSSPPMVLPGPTITPGSGPTTGARSCAIRAGCRATSARCSRPKTPMPTRLLAPTAGLAERASARNARAPQGGRQRAAAGRRAVGLLLALSSRRPAAHLLPQAPRGRRGDRADRRRRAGRGKGVLSFRRRAPFARPCEIRLEL